MMLAAQISQAIEGAHTVGALDHLSQMIWKGVSAGALDDEAAHELLGAINARRQPARDRRQTVGHQPGRASIFPPRRPQPSPRTAKCLSRRRQLVAAGPMPPHLAANFTPAELAALMIIREEVRLYGACSRSIAEVAARAGVGRTTVQNAVRQAVLLGLIIVKERRQRGDKNLTNVIRIVSQEWLAWIASWKAARNGASIGFKKVNPTDNGKTKGFPKRRVDPGKTGSPTVRRGWNRLITGRDG
jgi:hypothetical protein